MDLPKDGHIWQESHEKSTIIFQIKGAKDIPIKMWSSSSVSTFMWITREKKSQLVKMSVEFCFNDLQPESWMDISG